MIIRKGGTIMLQRNVMLDEKESAAFDILRVFSILSVIAAHTNNIIDGNVSRYCITFYWSSYGTVGVISFLIAGGFFYSRKEKDTSAFWKNKIRKLIVPWILCSSLTYILSIAMNGLPANGSVLLAYVKWVLGSGSWYYYMTVYVICQIIFRFISKSDIALWMTVFITAAMLILGTMGFYFQYRALTLYLNILYWVGFFALGILIRKHGILKYMIGNAQFLISLVASVVCFLFMLQIKKCGYFGFLSGIWEVLAFCFQLNLSLKFANTRICEILKKFGMTTFCIYLIHMQIVQFACKLLPQTAVFDLLRPFVGLALMAFVVMIAMWGTGKLPFGKTIRGLVGLPINHVR